MRRLLLMLCLLPALLTACTGTTEDAVVIRLAVLSGTGASASLRAVDVGQSAGAPSVNVPGAVDIETLPGGSSLAVLYGDHLETRDVNLGNPVVRANPGGASFKPCYVKLEASVARDRLAALSDCGGGALQQVVVWRSDGSLALSATLPAPTPSTPLQTRIAVQGDTVWVVHPAVGAGSELIIVTRNSDGSSSLSTPVATPLINDLAFFKGAVYAATDTGVKTLSASGVLTALPSTTQLGVSSTRLYTDDRLLGSWQDTPSAPLLIWNGAVTGVPAYFGDLRDLTYAPDGTLYTLSSGTLTQFDSAYGLAGSGWRNRELATFSDPRAVTWLIPLGP
ncbi:hypothetical protein DKM44_14835 [Deinococcus irradiatisoli]|uniref:Uncharacterized protein n=1 Tax=Deinococcus irradiatisoli TaxID=2202254 RepID=A0A2Z3JV13_9DEIO|nr:hypothetical protein [Deinococcus irradiatisoli]AWN24344.1 hypothetical protein DKM44_14835 [Deinococcus irradiatisoli]